MKKLYKYLPVILIILVSCTTYYIFWSQNRKEFTEDQLISKMFKCPEQYTTEEEKFESYKQFGSFYLQKYPTSTMEDILNRRYEFLVKNECNETLQIWHENEREMEEYWEDVYRQESVRSVMGSTTSNI